MSVIEFGREQDRNYHNGLDHAVLYVEDGPVVPWSGLQTLEDGGSSDTRSFYLDGVKYMTYVTPRDWSANLTCVTFPQELNPALGLGEVGDGFYADSQVPTRFSLSYRTMVTTPDALEPSSYKIHLIFKVMAALQSFSHTSLSDAADPMPFTMDLSATPMQVPLMRPTSHFIFDSREVDPVSMTAFQKIIYGSATSAPRLPTIAELVDMLRFSNNVRVIDNGDGTWTVLGSKANVLESPDGSFVLNNVASTDPDGNGNYLLTVTP